MSNLQPPPPRWNTPSPEHLASTGTLEIRRCPAPVPLQGSAGLPACGMWSADGLPLPRLQSHLPVPRAELELKGLALQPESDEPAALAAEGRGGCVLAFNISFYT